MPEPEGGVEETGSSSGNYPGIFRFF